MSNTLNGLDLNLLLTLEALLNEHSVTRAAARLHLSQPSVSVQLARLRDFFGDPLFLPATGGMLPTARAEQLRQPLRDALDALKKVTAPAATFEPAKATHTWKIAAFDYSEFTALLPALPVIRQAAAATRLSVVQLPPLQIARRAAQGDIDLAFLIRDEAASELRYRSLFTERYVLATRRGHSRVTRRPTLSQFCKLDHAIVSPEGGGFRGATDAVLDEHGLSRRVAVSVPHFLFLETVVSRTDLVAVMPFRLVRDNPRLQWFELPVPVPGFDLLMAWPERVHGDPAHLWLRDTIATSL